MYSKILLFVAAIILLNAPAQAAPEELVSYRLSLAGYRIGMSYDEAAAIRPFQYVQDVSTRPDASEVSYFDAIIDHVYVNDIEMTMRLGFRDGVIQRIICRFSPELMPQMLDTFQTIMGPGTNKSRTHHAADDAEILQTVYLWDFPTAKMHLISVSTVENFATASLVAKQKDHNASQNQE